MPNEPSERTRSSREPHARPRGPHAFRPEHRPPSRTGRSEPPQWRRDGAAGALRTPAGVGMAVVAAVAVLLALSALLGSANRDPSGVAAAGGTLPPTAPSSHDAGLAAGPSSPSPMPTPAAPQPVATPSIAPAPTVDPLAGVPSTRLQKALDAWRRKTGVPGLSVAIVWDDGRAWAGSSGFADVRAKEPMTTGRAFAFASVSKTFTAAVVMQLVDEGRIALDQPAVELLPDYPLDRRITVRMLLDHRSSLPDYFSNAKIDKALQKDKEAAWTAARTWKYVPKWRPRPGSIYDYSNTNYLLLGELVERVTGKPLSTEVRTRLLDPLQLNTAWYQGAESPRAKGTTGYRLTRTGSGSRVTPIAGEGSIMPFRSVVTAAGGAGSVAGTAMDAARWMQAFGSGSILGPRMHGEMVADAKYSKAMRALVTYGLGVQVITIEKQQTLGHSGRYLGFQNTVRYLRGPGISIAILTNQNTYDPGALMKTLVRAVAPVK